MIVCTKAAELRMRREMFACNKAQRSANDEAGVDDEVRHFAAGRRDLNGMF
jgi:hypothetical protein